MKRIIYITILALMLLAACTKPSPAPAPAPEHFSKYIFFSHSVETKAPLVEKAENIGTFGVVGFKYDSNTDWAKYSTTPVNGKLPTPNVFYDPVTDPETQQVTNELVNVETVSVDGTQTCTYAPLQGWSNSKKYAFFAFYPMPNGNNVKLVNLSGDDYTGGVPAIKYTMAAPEPSTDEGPADGAAFKASMVDLMTAAPLTNLYWKSSSDYQLTDGGTSSNGEVQFTFSHRLSSLGLNIKNSTEVKYSTEGEIIDAGGITINSVTFTITGLANQSVIFTLGGERVNPQYDAKAIGLIACCLGMPENGVEIPNFATVPTNTEPPYTGTELSDKLIFIPQDAPVKFTVTVDYTRSHDGYADNNMIYTTQELSTTLVEGQKYLVNLNFKDSTVEVTLKNGAWVEIPSVEDTFI